MFERVTKDQEVIMLPGDCVLFYTDGVREAVDSKDVEFGMERMSECFRMAAPLYVQYAVLNRDLRAGGFPNTNFWVLPDDDIDAGYRTVRSGAMPERPFAYVSSASPKDPDNESLCRPGQANLQGMTIAPADGRY